MTDKDPASANFDSSPPVGVSQYDASIRQFTAAYEQLFTMAYSVLCSMVDEDSDLMIAGAGTGMEILTFGQGSHEWSMTGVDPSAEMLAIAKKKIARTGLSNPIRLFNGYVHDLPEDHLYDGATCILVMHFLPDDGSKLRLLESIARRLKSGSPFILADGFGEKDSETFNRTVSAWKTFVKARGVDPQTVEDGFSGQILKRLQFVPEERIEALLAEAGFEKPSRFYTGFLYGGWVAIKK
jgi:tRNA (cmo5U34)-methyltransferase